MILDIQFKIRSNPRYKEYLRLHSYWYRNLTRYPASFKEFEKEAKKFYKLTPTDKISRAGEALEMINAFMQVLK